jgi:PAS domain S-box-containing protein
MVRELLHEEIVSQMTDSVVLISAEGEIIYFNQAAAQHHQLVARPLAQGTLIFDVVHPARRPIAKILITNAIVSRLPQSTVAEYPHPNGYSYYFSITYNPIIRDEKVRQIAIVAHDITAHKTFELRSTDLLRELNGLIDNANAVIFAVDSRGYLTDWNKESALLLGYSKNEILAKRIELLVRESDRASLQETLEVVANGGGVTNRELMVQSKEHDEFVLLVNASPRMNARGQVVGVMFMGQDITELTEYRKSLEKKVEIRTQKLKQALSKERELVEVRNKFIAIASHEFKIPLASIGTSVNLLLGSKHVSQRDEQALLEIARQVAFMKSMLADVLTLGKEQTTGIAARHQRLNLVALMQNIIMEVVSGTQFTHNVITDFPQPEIYIDSDDKLLRGIFINILSNAIKFSPGKQEVHVKLRTDSERVCVDFKDFGLGISPDDLSKVFEPFSRGANSEGISGTGLGLSIVKRSAEAVGATLHVDSKLNDYTTFSVSLLLSQR